MSHHEPAGVKLAPAKLRNLPNRILRAFDNAKHLSGVPRGVKDTLAELCRFIPQDEPFATVFAHKAKIAERIGASVRTIYRHLDTLQRIQLIEILPQERKSRNGRFAVARIRLTRQAAALLGFIAMDEEAPPASIDSDPDISIPSISVSDEATCPVVDATPESTNDTVIQESSISKDMGLFDVPPHDKMSLGHTLSEPTLAKSQPHNRPATHNGLPIDLAWMTGNGLSKAGIFKLMSLAKKHGKRLSDITLVVHEFIQELKGGRLFAYLAALCKGKTDFAYAAVQERKRLIDKTSEQNRQQQTALFRRQFAGKTLTNADHTKLFVLDDKARFAKVYDRDGRCSAMPLTDLTPWMDDMAKGKLVVASTDVAQRLNNPKQDIVRVPSTTLPIEPEVFINRNNAMSQLAAVRAMLRQTIRP